MQKPRIVTFWSQIRSKYSLPHKYKDSCLTLFLVISLLVTKYSYFSPLFVCRFNYSLSFIFWPWQGWWALRKMRLKKGSLSLRLDHAENVLIRHLVPPARPRPKNSRYFHDGGQIVVATRLRLQHTPRPSSAHFFLKQPNRDTWKIEIIKRELRKNGTTWTLEQVKNRSSRE